MKSSSSTKNLVFNRNKREIGIRVIYVDDFKEGEFESQRQLVQEEE